MPLKLTFFQRSLRHASLCDETSIKALISDDFTESGRCNFYVMHERFLTTSGVMAFQVFHFALYMVPLCWFETTHIVNLAFGVLAYYYPYYAVPILPYLQLPK